MVFLMSLAIFIGAVTAPPPMPATYSGRGPCADCSEIQSRITLLADGNYVESRTYVGRSVTPLVERGTWLWESDADTMGLTTGGHTAYYRARNGKLIALDASGDPIQGPQTVLIRSAHVDAVSQSKEPRMTLESTTWQLIELNGTAVHVHAAQRAPSLEFDGPTDRVSGSTGCNRLNGKYKYDEGMMHFTPFATTRMACVDAPVDESALLRALASVTSYAIANRTLVLRSANATVARYRAKTPTFASPIPRGKIHSMHPVRRYAVVGEIRPASLHPISIGTRSPRSQVRAARFASAGASDSKTFATIDCPISST
jgi:copper homeostasis protein (lipoprotein)